MKNMMKNSHLLLLFIILAACAPEQNSIKIGIIAPLTGNLANVGQELVQGMNIARDEINAAGGINGKQLQLVVEDGKCDPKEATSAATKLIQIDRVKVIIGGTCTGESMAIAPIATQNKVVELSPMTSGSVYSNTGEWTFRTNPVDRATEIVQLLADKHFQKLAIISEQTAFSQSIRTDFKANAEKQGMSVVADENFESKEVDFRSYLTKMQSASPDAYFLNTNSGPVGTNLARQAKELGLTPLYGSRGYELANPAQFPKELEGITFYGSAGVVNTNTSQATKLFDAYRKRTGKEPFCAFCVASQYDDTKLIAQALQACGENTECMKNWLYTMQPYQGVIGTRSEEHTSELQSQR